MFTSILIIIGLALFETVSSIDNAVINAQVLTTMSKRAKRWFLTYGLIIAVFFIRGLFPFFIVWMANPAIGPLGALSATFSSDPHVRQSIEASAPLLLTAGGTFLLLLFFHWLFLEKKNFGLRGEKFIFSKGVWFYAVASVLLTGIIWLSLQTQPSLALSAAIGFTVFFITNGFKENAKTAEKELLAGKGSSDLSKLLYLEVIDATFSIDGVIGAFAFTLSILLIFIGNGIGAYIVREITLRNVEKIKKYKYLENGAMYSIFFLGCVMLLNSFGFTIPEWVTPLFTIIIISFFFYKSKVASSVV
jgi:hypothetical protein